MASLPIRGLRSTPDSRPRRNPFPRYLSIGPPPRNWRRALLDPSEHPLPAHRETAALLAAAGWAEYQDRLVRGLCHDFNGRLTSLHAISQLAGSGAPRPPAADTELERLEALVSRLADLVGDLGAAPAPLVFRELLDRALRHAREVEKGGDAIVRERVSGTLTAVLVNEGRCLRALLLFVAWAVGACPPGTTCVLDIAGSPEGVVMRFRVGAEPLDAAAVSALDRVMAMDGGSVSVDADNCALRLPSLARAREAQQL